MDIDGSKTMNANDFCDILTFILVQFYLLEFFASCFFILVLKIHWLSCYLSEERLAGANHWLIISKEVHTHTVHAQTCTYIPGFVEEVCCCTGNMR